MLGKTPKESAKKTKSARRFPTQVILGLAMLMVVLIASILAARSTPKGYPSPVYDRTNCVLTIPELDTVGSNYYGSAPPKECVFLERAATAEQRTLGLSGRDFIPRDSGMLFTFDFSGRQCMWMKDMNFSIDMLWLNEQKEVTKIEKNVSPKTYPTTFCGDNTKYVIELNSGTIDQAGLHIGDSLHL